MILKHCKFILVILTTWVIPLFFNCVFASTAQPLHFKIQRWTSGQRIPVYYVYMPQLPMVDIQVVFKAGSAYDGPHYGLASLTSSLLNEGTSTLSSDQVADGFDSVGAQYSAAMSRDMSAVHLRTLTKAAYLNPALTMYLDVLTKPSFPADAFKRVQQQTLALIRHRQQSPSKMALVTFYHLLYGNQPYGHPVVGDAKEVAALTRQDVMQFYRQYYVACNAKIIIVGALAYDQAKVVAKKIADALPRGQAASRLPTMTMQSHKNIFVSFPVQQNTVIVGQIAIDRHNPDYFPLMIGNHILGGSSMNSILFNDIRNRRGYVYYVTSQFIPLQRQGPFLIFFQSRLQAAEQALELAKKDLQQFIAQGPTPAQLHAAKANLIGSFPLKIATNSAILNNVTNIAFYNLPLDYMQSYRRRIRAVTAQQIKHAFAKTLKPNQMVMVTVGAKKVSQN